MFYCFIVLQTNTFQAIIISDNKKSFIFFLYEQIQWVAGSASNGIAAQVQFFQLLMSLSITSCPLLEKGHTIKSGKTQIHNDLAFYRNVLSFHISHALEEN